MGFVLNRPSGFELSSVFRPRGVTVSNDPVYTGGPVAREGAYLLLRSARRPKGGEAVAADVYFTGNLEALDEALRESVRPDRLRVFIGYSGWGAGQLDNEIEAGAWHVFAGEPALAFDPKPETLWRRLIRKTDLNVARHSGGLAATARNRRPIRPGVPAAGGGFR
jgi:putative transcriptional regulator